MKTARGGCIVVTGGHVRRPRKRVSEVRKPAGGLFFHRPSCATMQSPRLRPLEKLPTRYGWFREATLTRSWTGWPSMTFHSLTSGIRRGARQPAWRPVAASDRPRARTLPPARRSLSMKSSRTTDAGTTCCERQHQQRARAWWKSVVLRAAREPRCWRNTLEGGRNARHVVMSLLFPARRPRRTRIRLRF